jgi:hypothetical protein
MQSVGDRDGDLGRVGVLTGFVLGEADHLAGTLREQRPVSPVWRGTGPVRRQLGRTSARREEPQPQILRGRLLVESPQLLVIASFHGADADGRAVREQSVDTGRLSRSSVMACLLRAL